MADEERQSAGTRGAGGGPGEPERRQQPGHGYPQQPMAPRRITISAVLQWTAVALTAVVAIVFIGTLILSGTDWGRERVRRIVLGRLQKMTHGQVTIGRITGN